MASYLDELKVELADLEPQVEAFDEQLSALRAKKDALRAEANKQNTEILAVASQRDSLRRRVMMLQREIGQIEGIPELRVN